MAKAKKPPLADYTPREAAYSIALERLGAEYHKRTCDLRDYAVEGSARERAIRRQIAKLYNRLLDTSGMDGLSLDEDVT